MSQSRKTRSNKGPSAHTLCENYSILEQFFTSDEDTMRDSIQIAFQKSIKIEQNKAIEDCINEFGSRSI